MEYAATDRVNAFFRAGYFTEDRGNGKVGEVNDTRWTTANGGVRITPRLVLPQDETAPRLEPVAFDPETDPRSLKLSQANLSAVRDGMFRVVNSARGTGYGARIKDKGFEFAGKSGTAQVRGISVAERDQGLPAIDKIPWEHRDHALFVAYAPADAPKIAVAVLVENAGFGAAAAAPIARKVFDYYLLGKKATPVKAEDLDANATRD